MNWQIHLGSALDVLRTMPKASVDACVTSPPYWGLRDYKIAGQIGLQQTPDEYVSALVAVFREVARVMKPTAALWLNLGDSFVNAKGQAGGSDPKQPARRHGLRPQDVAVAGLKRKDLVGIPWMTAFALRADGWWLRRDQIWSKPNPMPDSALDRTTSSHEYVFLMTRSERYYFSPVSIRETYSDSTRSVWTIATGGSTVKHLAMMPRTLARKLVMSVCPPEGTVLDPFAGSGTTLIVALEEGRNAIGIELNPESHAIARARCVATVPLLAAEATA